MPGDQPSRMLAVLLGASTFPNAPKLAEGRAFYLSAADVKEYLWDERGLALPRRNTLSLFDDSRSPSDQLMEVANFLVRRTLELKNEGTRPEDLLIYYVGHGLFTRGDQAYCLAVRSTNELNEGATSIRAGDLAGVVKENAAFLRRYIILDCCFAASIHKEFQSGALGAARVQMANEFPARGTALLCSSNAHEASLAPQGLEHTMFSDALIRSLRAGHPSCGARLSFSELGDLIQENLRSEYPERWVRPEVHSPDQREGDIAHLPMFPNPAYQRREAVEEREAAENAAAELAAQKETGRIAREKAEAERIAAQEKAEQDRLTRQAAEADRIAAEKGAAERAAAQKEAEQERLERRNAEAERSAREKAYLEKIAFLKADAERERAEQERLVRQKAEAARISREKAEAQRIAAESAANRAVEQAGATGQGPSPVATKTGLAGKLQVTAVLLLVIAIWAWNHFGTAPQRTLPAKNSQTSDSSTTAPNSEKPDPGTYNFSGTPPSKPARTEAVGAHFSIGGSTDAPTVLDNRSGLMWTRKDYWAVEGKFAGDWNEAMQWARRMNAAAYAGYSDWRVPTIAQYRTINNSKADRDEYARTFEKTDGTDFWSSNTPNQNVASYISFTEGYAVSGSRTDPMYRKSMGEKAAPLSVRLVRTK